MYRKIFTEEIGHLCNVIYTNSPYAGCIRSDTPCRKKYVKLKGKNALSERLSGDGGNITETGYWPPPFSERKYLYR